MPPTTIPVLHFREALARYPDARYAPYNRVTSRSQSGPDSAALRAKTAAMLAEARAVAPGRLRHMPFSGVEAGKLSRPRPALEAAVEWCLWRSYPIILVTSDLSRFIRAEDYHRVLNPDAWPTDEEFARLREMTGGLILATLLDPYATEGERHRAATMRTGRVGRPREFDYETACGILRTLGPSRRDDRGRAEWSVPLSVAARRHGVTKSMVQCLLDAPVPGMGGERWKDLPDPFAVYRELFIPNWEGE